eukprot:TRINITY_DN8781_c0_g1_i1.p1 TRINITY_DN8781_c0_g1~~TRINITY_DN8781_c0_g1_i1.p1  ORF type:complete len:158 (-),score=38.16 TRINITY_DN8781_c0_g1_i1:33-476(-)
MAHNKFSETYSDFDIAYENNFDALTGFFNEQSLNFEESTDAPMSPADQITKQSSLSLSPPNESTPQLKDSSSIWPATSELMESCSNISNPNPSEENQTKNLYRRDERTEKTVAQQTELQRPKKRRGRPPKKASAAPTKKKAKYKNYI